MKKIIPIILIYLSFSSYIKASENFSKPIENCSNYYQYINTGWIIHPPKNFQAIAKETISKVNTGLSNGTIVYDMSGTLMNHDTPDSTPVFIDAAMWDDLRTDSFEMYGDIAILKDSQGTQDLVEIRWYDGKKRNLVINTKLINCMTEDAPYVENSVL